MRTDSTRRRCAVVFEAPGLDVEVADDPAVDPVVPTVPPIWLPCCKQPEIETVSALLLVLLVD